MSVDPDEVGGVFAEQSGGFFVGHQDVDASGEAFVHGVAHLKDAEAFEDNQLAVCQADVVEQVAGDGEEADPGRGHVGGQPGFAVGLVGRGGVGGDLDGDGEHVVGDDAEHFLGQMFQEQDATGLFLDQGRLGGHRSLGGDLARHEVVLAFLVNDAHSHENGPQDQDVDGLYHVIDS